MIVVGVVLALLAGLVVGVLLTRLRLRYRVDEWAASTLATWRAAEESTIRVEAAKRSEAVLRGRMTEQLAPFLYEFPYTAADARFIGNPVDFVIFDGYTEVKAGTRADLRAIIFVDIKTGAAKLTTIQRRIKTCIEANHVWSHVLDAGGGI